MEISSHPSSQLQTEWIKLIRKSAPIAEQARQLMPEQLELAYQQQWFKMLVPKLYGGLELALNDEVRLIEALSWADGSLGWVITLCTGAGWFGGFLDPTLATDIFAGRDVCLAGSGAPTGTAEEIADGYLINGHWKYASGALNTTHFTANCKIVKNGQPVLNDSGEQLILPFVFKSDEVNVMPAWSYTGMVATGSHSFEVTNKEVSKNRSFKIDPDFRVIDKPLYTYPFLQLAEATLAVNISGMVIHFIDLCEISFAEKRTNKNLTISQNKELDHVLNYSIQRMSSVRECFYDALDYSWTHYNDSDMAKQLVDLQNVSNTSRRLAKQARQIMDELYPYCGLEAARTLSELNRVWRDVHTASQHSLLTFSS
jgi:hypothetical protein